VISLGDGPFRDKFCRDIILAELRTAGVTNITVEEKEVQVLDSNCPAAQTPPGITIPGLAKSFHQETHYRVSANLRGWKIMRAWTYWIVTCKEVVDEIHPVDAMALFKINGEEMRVSGHCGCPAPEGSYLNYRGRVDMNLVDGGYDFSVDGKHVRFLKSSKDGESFSDVFKALDKEFPGKRGGVEMYHIDTQAALNAFCNYMTFRGAERDKALEAFYDERSRTDNWDLKHEVQLDNFVPAKKFSVDLISTTEVQALIQDCLVTDEEQAKWPDPKNPPRDQTTVIAGITKKFVFHPGRLVHHREDVHDALRNLPRAFLESVGKGHSFTRMILDRNGNQWCEKETAEELLVLGMGVGLAEYCTPRHVWDHLPGKMPYVIVYVDEPTEKEEPCPTSATE
jgi:hypothetical protein